MSDKRMFVDEELSTSVEHCDDVILSSVVTPHSIGLVSSAGGTTSGTFGRSALFVCGFTLIALSEESIRGDMLLLRVVTPLGLVKEGLRRRLDSREDDFTSLASAKRYRRFL